MTTVLARYALLFAFASVPCLTPAQAWAAGGDDDASSSSQMAKCPEGKVRDKASGKCVDKQSSILNDDDRAAYAVLLAKSGLHEEAISVLEAAADQNDPRILNYLGYNHRKAGRLEMGLSFYKRALAINPDYVLVREYLGEAYVENGRIDLAEVQLAEIAKRCGEGCEEFRALAEVIASAKS